MEERIYQGQVYRRNGPGEQWTLAGPAPSQQGRIIPRGENTVRKEGAEADISGLRAQELRETVPYAAPRAQADIALTREQAQGASLRNEQLERELRATEITANPEIKRAQASLRNDAVLDRIAQARRQVQAGWATGNFAGGGGFARIPFIGQNAANLAETITGLQGGAIVDELERMKQQSSTGASGLGALSEKEGERLAAAIASLSQVQDQETLMRELARMERHYRNYKAFSNGEDPRLPEVAERYGIVSDDPLNAEPQAPAPSETELRSDGRFENDPALSGANATVNRMIRGGRTEQEIRDYLNQVQPGLGDRAANIGVNVDYAAQNPDFTPTVDVEQVWVPSSGVMNSLGDAALFEIGGFSPGAAVIGAADMASLGYLDEISGLLGGSAANTGAVMEGVQQRNPMSYLGGQVAGGIGTGLGIEAGLARTTGLSGLGRARVGDIGFGAAYGSGSAEEGQALQGAALGGALGGAGGAIARNLSNVAGTAMTGLTDTSRRYLSDRGVNLSVGQMMGGGLKSLEDRLAGLPIAGEAINSIRRRGQSDFNRAAFDEGLSPAGLSTGGEIAETGIDNARRLISDEYERVLGPVNIIPDPMYSQQLGVARQSASALPSPLDEQAGYALQRNIDGIMDPQGYMTGRDFQGSLQGLRRARGSLEGQPFGYEFGNVMGQAEDALTGALQRQAPQGTADAFQGVNQAYRNEEILRDAVNRARNTGGEFTPAQLSTSSAQNARRFGNAQGTTNQPFYDLTRHAQAVMPRTIPDPGTAGQTILPYGAAAGAGAFLAPEGEGMASGGGAALGLAAALGGGRAAFGSASVRDSVARALLSDRNPATRELGQKILENDRIASALMNSLVLAETQDR